MGQFNYLTGPNPQNQYPKRFGNAEQLPLAPGCVATALSEYPLTNVIPYQNLSQPGRFRVVVNLLTNSTDVRYAISFPWNWALLKKYISN
jgi:hypothetical protein